MAVAEVYGRERGGGGKRGGRWCALVMYRFAGAGVVAEVCGSGGGGRGVRWRGCTVCFGDVQICGGGSGGRGVRWRGDGVQHLFAPYMRLLYRP